MRDFPLLLRMGAPSRNEKTPKQLRVSLPSNDRDIVAGRHDTTVANSRLIFMTILALSTLFISPVAARTTSQVTLEPPFELRKSWGPYTPYYAVEKYRPAPWGCKVTQVNIIQRHGARYPTAKAGARIAVAVSKLKSANNYTDPRLEFLKTYQYTLGADNLVPFGAQEALDAGKDHFARYRHLVKKNRLPFVRASGSNRVVESATNWTKGLAIASNYLYRPKLDLILPENLNDTLDDAMCPNAGDSDFQTAEWLSIYGSPVATRLNAQAPGANLTIQDIESLISLCPFESLSTPTLSHSPFCNLFTASEFKQYEYSSDIGKFYGTGYGQALGPIQGVGYINELLARLRGKPVRDHTQTNRTLDSSPTTFPLNRTIYIDFSHDNQMIAIYAAMNLFRQSKPLNTTHPDNARSWVVSQLVPFSGRMITEKLMCGSREYVRIFVNDALQPLEFCGKGDGVCTLKAFVKSQDYARHDGYGDFEKCYT